MKEKLFHSEGPVFSFLDKVGQMILLNLVWILGCLPIVTVATSTTALYYAVMKNIRRDYGTAMGEFWHSYRANLKRGIPISVVGLVVAGILVWNIRIMTQSQQDNNLLLWGSVILLALLCAIAIYICPVLSRFNMKAGAACKLAFVMAIRFLPITVLLAAGTVALVYLQIFVLPIPTVLLLPSVWCWTTTFLMEKALRRFMPPKEEKDDSWYYQ